MAEPVTEGHAARRLIAAMLLRACLDAHKGDVAAQAWLTSDDALGFAEWLNLTRWPPTLEQLASHDELSKRANKNGVKLERIESARLDFSIHSNHTGDNRTKRARQVLSTPNGP